MVEYLVLDVWNKETESDRSLCKKETYVTNEKWERKGESKKTLNYR